MELLFNAEGILQRGKGLTFDDVLLFPRHTTLNSRQDPELGCQVTKKRRLQIPLISANMDTITEFKMASMMAKLGGLGILHRFMSLEEQAKQCRALRDYMEEHKLDIPVAASIGVNKEGQERADILVDSGAEILTIDIAHGDSELMFKTLDYVKQKFPQIEVIAGNTATPEGVKGMIEHGADAIKIGIGPGSMCTTRIITGCGVPQLTAVALAAHEAKKHNVPIIADGGIKTSGDMVKALAAGADTVMLGSLFSGCLETPGKVSGGKKKYRGMASKDAQVSWRGNLPKGMAAEGVDVFVTCKGSAEDVAHELVGGIRSGMSYLNAYNLSELQANASFMEMSAQGMQESKPHGAL